MGKHGSRTVEVQPGLGSGRVSGTEGFRFHSVEGVSLRRAKQTGDIIRSWAAGYLLRKEEGSRMIVRLWLVKLDQERCHEWRCQGKRTGLVEQEEDIIRSLKYLSSCLVLSTDVCWESRLSPRVHGLEGIWCRRQAAMVPRYRVCHGKKLKKGVALD